MVLVFSLSAINLVDAKTPYFSPGNGKVTCAAIKAQILAQTPITMTDPKSHSDGAFDLWLCATRF